MAKEYIFLSVCFLFIVNGNIVERNGTSRGLNNFQLNVGLLQDRRPPQQTFIQNSVRSKNTFDAPTQSKNSYNYVYGLMQAAVNSGKLKGIPQLRNAKPDELMHIFEWEFKHLPIIHNAPIIPDDALVGDDTDLHMLLTNGYIQNIAQRYLLGYEEQFPHFIGEIWQQTEFMNYPPFKDAYLPTLREANDRIMYFANNILKRPSGNPIYGKAMFVMNSLYKDKWFLTPYDTGQYINEKTVYGSMDDWYHLVKPHLDTYKYDVTDLFLLWFGGVNNFAHNGVNIETCFYEVELSGNAWLPEAMLYLVLYYDDLWGTEEGERVQLWSHRNKRPLVWANGDNDGMIIDPSVNHVTTTDDGYISSAMVDHFRELWFTHLPFRQFYQQMDPALHFFYNDYFRNFDACQGLDYPGTPYQIMGTNTNMNCVYWMWQEDMATLPWELLNDGTCERSARGLFMSEEMCQQEASSVKWSRQQGANIKGNAEDKATFCVQNRATGSCASLDACEASIARGEAKCQ